MNHDAYICYSTEDREIANRVCEVLEQNNIKCWIAPRNITTNEDFSTQIKNAIKNSKMVVLIYSRNASEDDLVKKCMNDVEKPIFVYNLDGSPFQSDSQFSSLNIAGIVENSDDAFETLINNITHMTTEGIFKPQTQIVGMDKPQGEFSNNSISPYVYLSYNDKDLNFINAQINQFNNLKNLVKTSDKITLKEDIYIKDNDSTIDFNRDDLVIDGEGHSISAENTENIFNINSKNSVGNKILKLDI